METPEPNSENNQQGLYPIRTVSDLTGVNAITLRAWERRYDLFTPVRKSSGHRLYTQEHIDLITRIVGLLDRGMRIGQVKSHLEVEQSEVGVQSRSDNFWQVYRDRMVSSVIQFSEERLEAAYGEALSLFPVDQVTENLLSPVLKELGRRWSSNEGSIAEEHFFSFYIRNKLGARYHHRKKNVDAPKLLLACLPGERHEIGLLLFGLAASEMGYESILLGADVPLDELPAAAVKAGSSGIVLSGFFRPSASIIEQELPALCGKLEVPVFLGGRASVEAHDDLKHSCIHLLGTDLQGSLKRLARLVPPIETPTP